MSNHVGLCARTLLLPGVSAASQRGLGPIKENNRLYRLGSQGCLLTPKKSGSQIQRLWGSTLEVLASSLWNPKNEPALGGLRPGHAHRCTLCPFLPPRQTSVSLHLKVDQPHGQPHSRRQVTFPVTGKSFGPHRHLLSAAPSQRLSKFLI